MKHQSPAISVGTSIEDKDDADVALGTKRSVSFLAELGYPTSLAVAG